MKTLLISVILFLLLNIGIVSAQDTLWTRTYGVQNVDKAYSVQQTVDGNFILAGDGFTNLIKVNSSGDTIWSKKYDVFGNARAFSVKETFDQGYILAGFGPNGSGGTAAILVKTDLNGNIEWGSLYGRENTEYAQSVCQTPDSGFIFAGITGQNSIDIYIVRLNSNGDSIWTKTFSSQNNDFGYSILKTDDNNYIVVGSYNHDAFMAKLDDYGNTIWEHTYGGGVFYSVDETNDGGFILTGSKASDIYVVSTDNVGNVLWTKTFGGIYTDKGHSIRENLESEFILTGETLSSSNPNDIGIFVMKLDTLGNQLWDQVFDKPGIDQAFHLDLTNDGGVIVCGSTQIPGNSLDYWILRIYETGLILSADINDFRFDNIRDSVISKTFQIFNHDTIGYAIPYCDSHWVSFSPDSINLDTQDTASIVVTFNALNLDYRTYLTEIYFESNAPGLENVTIPVQMTVWPAANINVTIPNNNLQAGDTLSAYITVTNPTYFNTKAWIATAMTLPNEELYGPVFGPYDFRLFPYGAVSGRIDHVVPSYAMLGDYEYLVRVSPKADLLTIMGQSGTDFSIYSFSRIMSSYNDDPWDIFFTGFNTDEYQLENIYLENTPHEFALFQNTPNPFNANTTISFLLPYQSDVRIDVYNLNGQKVENLIDNTYPEGEHSVIWDASAYSSGIYFYKFNTGNEVMTKRLVLLK